MRQIDNYIIHIKSDVISHQDDPGKTTHDDRWQQLENKVAANATTTIPPDILKGCAKGKTVTVTPETMDALKNAQKIAEVTKRILKKGSPNQELDLIRSSGLNNLVSNYGRLVMPKANSSTAEHAINSAIAGAARCGDYGRVAYTLAQLLNLPAKLVEDPWNDHTFVLLNPDSETPVKCDPWSVLATVCLASESDYPNHVKIAEHRVGDPQPDRFNLASIKEIRRRLKEKLGPDAIQSAAVEQERKTYGFSSKLLDKVLLQQGLMRYDKISTADMSPQKKTAVEAEQARIVKLVQEMQLQGAAREVWTRSKAESVINTRVTRAKIDAGADKNVIKEHTAQAKQDATAAATQAAEKAALKKVRNAAEGLARKDGLVRPKDVVVRDAIGTATKTTGTVTATVEVKAVGHLEPRLWDGRVTTSALNTYESPDGTSIRFDKISPGQLQQIRSAMSAAKKRNFPDAYIKASDTGGHRKSASMSLAGASTSGAHPLTGHRRSASLATPGTDTSATITEAQLLNATVNKVNALLDELAGLQQESANHANDPNAQVFARQKAIIKMLDDRLEHLSEAQLSTNLRQLAEELPSLRHGALDDAIDLLQVWMINVPDDQSSIAGAISDARSNSSYQATDSSEGSEEEIVNVDNENNSDSINDSPEPVINQDVDDTGEVVGPFAGMNPGEVAEQLGLLLGDLATVENAQLPELRTLLDHGMARLRDEDDDLFRNTGYELRQQWIQHYGAPGLGDVLNAVAERYLPSGEVVSTLSVDLPNYDDPALRDRAIGAIGRHMGTIPANSDALNGAARMIGQAIQMLRNVDQQLELMRILDGRLDDIGQMAQDDLIDKLERAAQGNNLLTAQLDEMFPPEEN